jgi:hypothetical protein
VLLVAGALHSAPEGPRGDLALKEGDCVFHLDKSLGLGEVLELSTDDALISFRDPVSGELKKRVCSTRELIVVEKDVATPKREGRLILRTNQSRRNRTGDIKQCAECRECRSGLWKFTDTSWGTVYLCDHCKTDAMNRTYRPADALTVAVSGGRWGSMR